MKNRLQQSKEVPSLIDIAAAKIIRSDLNVFLTKYQELTALIGHLGQASSNEIKRKLSEAGYADIANQVKDRWNNFLQDELIKAGLKPLLAKYADEQYKDVTALYSILWQILEQYISREREITNFFNFPLYRIPPPTNLDYVFFNEQLDVSKTIQKYIERLSIEKFNEHYVDLFSISALNGFKSLTEKLWEKGNHVQRQVMLQNVGNDAFSNAARKGHIEVLKWLWKVTADNPEVQLAMLQADNYMAFRDAARFRNIEVLKWLWEVTADKPEVQQAMLQADNYGAFRESASNVDGLKWFWNITTDKPEVQLAMLDEHSNYIFHDAIGLIRLYSRIDVLEWLWENIDSEQKLEIIENTFLENFIIAVSRGNFELLKWLWENIDSEQKLEIIKNTFLENFKMAVSHGNIELLEWLWEKNDYEQKLEIAANAFLASFEEAVISKKKDIANFIYNQAPVTMKATMRKIAQDNQMELQENPSASTPWYFFKPSGRTIDRAADTVIKSLTTKLKESNSHLAQAIITDRLESLFQTLSTNSDRETSVTNLLRKYEFNFTEDILSLTEQIRLVLNTNDFNKLNPDQKENLRYTFGVKINEMRYLEMRGSLMTAFNKQIAELYESGVGPYQAR